MIDNIEIKPLADRVVIKRIEERTTNGGIVIPDTNTDKSQRGTVIAVGPGKYENDKLQKLTLKCGDKVLFGKYSGTEINLKGKDYLIMKEDDIIAIIS